MSHHDAPAVLAIYQAGIDTITPHWTDFDARHLPCHRHIAHRGDDVLGWIAASPASTRNAYHGVVNDTVYVAPYAIGQGIGTALLRTLITSTERAGIWTIQAGIFPENTPSLALHTAHGFRIIGTSHRIARDATGTWRDVIRLERRSTTIGTD
jgi:L-amino acid N-acyltransferase YncA